MKNLMKKYMVVGLIMAICLMIANVAFAKDAQWVNKQADLSTIKKIYIDDTVNLEEGIKISPVDKLVISENLEKQKKFLKNVNFVNKAEQADAIISVKVLENTNKNYKVPETKETVYEKVIKINSEGKETSVSVPVVKVTPGYTYTNRYFSVEYEVQQPDGTKVFTYIDTREAPKAFENMLRRATKDFYRSFTKVLNNREKL